MRATKDRSASVTGPQPFGTDRAIALADQILSGLSNFLAVALVARSATPAEFGRFAVAYTLFVAELSLARRLWGTRLAMTSSHTAALVELRSLLGATVLALPVAIIALTVPSLLVTGWSTWAILLVLAVALPVVIAQDLCRYAAVAAGRPLVAAGSDLVWLVAVVAGYAVRPPILVALVIWAAGAVAGLIFALFALKILPAISQGWAVLRSRHATSEVSAIATVSSSLATYVTLGLASFTIGATAAGTLRGAPTVMAPVNTLFMFTGLAMLPVVFRASQREHPRFIARLSGLLLVAAVAWGGILLLLPDWAGELLLGQTWAGARSVLPWTTIEYVGLSIIAGVGLGFQARERARLLAVVSLLEAALVIVTAVVAALLATSARGYAAGLATASLISAAVVVVVYRWDFRLRRAQARLSEPNTSSR
jgi:O-antigen/teichoic acid export membrane protein